MSSSDPQDTRDPNSLAYYAPSWAHDRDALRPRRPRLGEITQAATAAPPEQRSNSNDTDRAPTENLRPLGPELAELANLVQQRMRINKTFAFGLASAGLASIAGAAAFLYAMNFGGLRGGRHDNETSILATPQEKKAAVAKLIKKMTAPALVTENGDGTVNAPLPLGVRVVGQPQGETVKLSGFPVDTRLTNGVLSGTGEWRVAVQDLPMTVVIPPRGYVGQMDIAAELPGDNGEPGLRGGVHLLWTQITPGIAARLATTESNASPLVNGAAREPARQMDPKEIAALIKRGEELMSSGDIPAARLLLQRAAEAHDARAAFELASTYDLAVIKQIGGNGTGPDLELAKTWYQRARDWGSQEAPKKLEALATAGR